MSKVPLAVFGRWHEKIAAVLAEPDRNRVPELLFDAVSELLDFDSGQMCVMGESIRPVDIYDDVPPEMHAANIASYYDGAYLLDPYYHAGVAQVEPGLYLLREVAPPGFRQSEYFRRYYRDSGMIDEAVSLTYLPDNLFIHTSYALFHGSPGFRQSQLNLVRLVQPVIDRVLIDFWQTLQRNKPEKVSDLRSELGIVLELFGDSLLTRRERQVVRHYLQGHSTRSIAERLGISQHTVAMHRKNAYLKLDIRSQAELFHLFIDSLDCYDATKRQDPLLMYMATDKPF